MSRESVYFSRFIRNITRDGFKRELRKIQRLLDLAILYFSNRSGLSRAADDWTCYFKMLKIENSAMK
jgi:hypothetical protein